MSDNISDYEILHRSYREKSAREEREDKEAAQELALKHFNKHGQSYNTVPDFHEIKKSCDPIYKDSQKNKGGKS